MRPHSTTVQSCSSNTGCVSDATIRNCSCVTNKTCLHIVQGSLGADPDEDEEKAHVSTAGVDADDANVSSYFLLYCVPAWRMCGVQRAGRNMYGYVVVIKYGKLNIRLHQGRCGGPASSPMWAWVLPSIAPPSTVPRALPLRDPTPQVLKYVPVPPSLTSLARAHATAKPANALDPLPAPLPPLLPLSKICQTIPSSNVPPLLSAVSADTPVLSASPWPVKSLLSQFLTVFHTPALACAFLHFPTPFCTLSLSKRRVPALSECLAPL
ncbi:hypothetical protein EDB83DRAFT_2444593 [Lactarius deliciosus]|nr:hypothetical protein EDB83DRAFT_2444593 [Lactarius deliciosus]